MPAFTFMLMKVLEMPIFEIVKGRKSDGDFIIRVYSYGEVWLVSDILQLLKIIFDSEKANYPIEKGFRGPAYLLNAITEICFGRDLELVLKDYKLSKPRVQIIEKIEEKQAEAKRKVGLWELIE